MLLSSAKATNGSSTTRSTPAAPTTLRPAARRDVRAAAQRGRISASAVQFETRICLYARRPTTP